MQTRACPNCGKEVPVDAISCKHCGALLFITKKGFDGNEQRAQTKNTPREMPAEPKTPVQPERRQAERPAPPASVEPVIRPAQTDEEKDPFDLSRISEDSFGYEEEEPAPRPRPEEEMLDLSKIRMDDETPDDGYYEDSADYPQDDDYYYDDNYYYGDEDFEELAAAKFKKTVIIVLSIIFTLLVALIVLLLIVKDDIAGFARKGDSSTGSRVTLTLKEEESLPEITIDTETMSDPEADTKVDSEEDSSSDEDSSSEEDSSEEDSSSEDDSSKENSLPDELIPDQTEPETEPPQTDPPQTEPPQTEPPQTDPPQTDPPETEPPVTDPPETQSSEFDPGTPDVTE
ncbi:zinc-ribbon domain-containing protein [Ruminococcus sp. YE71]|uniref:zinc ribbon domain-containing protein n=1 Tax=unclassified Ruminococcus TaxID=2608920 RepID=UPI00088AC629|nr:MULTISPECIES: zinc ribbon domain-containing protein [unclassified Ruminococcus]SDA16319.1 zinc-ribbon domain-containing protein [Ruminococcus sp. YE78]SFW24555.1 zinc-ribbon domain-containing protein [Ruminococcus sp. YE71]